MSKLTIKSGCVEAVFKRGRERRKTTESEQPVTAKRPPATPTAEPESPPEPKATEFYPTKIKG